MLNAQNTQTGSSTYIGVDIGGTNTRIGLFESLDAPDFALIARYPTDQSYEEQLRRIMTTIQDGSRENPAGKRHTQQVSFAQRPGLGAPKGHSSICNFDMPNRYFSGYLCICVISFP